MTQAAAAPAPRNKARSGAGGHDAASRSFPPALAGSRGMSCFLQYETVAYAPGTMSLSSADFGMAPDGARPGPHAQACLNCKAAWALMYNARPYPSGRPVAASGRAGAPGCCLDYVKG